MRMRIKPATVIALWCIIAQVLGLGSLRALAATDGPGSSVKATTQQLLPAPQPTLALQTATATATIPVSVSLSATPTDTASALAMITDTPSVTDSVTATATTQPSVSPTIVPSITVPVTLPTALPSVVPTALPTVGPSAAITTVLAAPLSFEANRGQTDNRVAFLAHGPGYILYLTPRGAALALASPPPAAPITSTAVGPITDGLPNQPRSTTVVGLRLTPVNANTAPTLEGLIPLPGTANYLVGNDSSHWQTDIPTYSEVLYHNVYPGINHLYNGTQGRLEDDWQIAPGADPSVIQFTVDGTLGLSVDAQGVLAIQTALGTLMERAPKAYQIIAGQRQDVPVQYTLTGSNQVGFALGSYDPSQPLTIDPILTYSTYLGGSNSDSGNSIATDAAGNAYVVGTTSSTNYITTTGAFSTTLISTQEAFVTKLSTAGNGAVYSTYLGGSGADTGSEIAVDGAGNAYITGNTTSNNFPTTAGAAQTSYGGYTDAFVTKLNASGSGLIYSTYLGGSGSIDMGTGIAVDGTGNAYVVGRTEYYSSGFPTTPNAYQRSHSGTNYNAFMAELNPNLSGSTSLVYSTYLGGSTFDYGFGIAVDGAGNAYVTGDTGSSDFPTTPNAYSNTFVGPTDAFVSKLNPNLSGSASLLYSTFLGGNGQDVANGIAVDGAGNAYVTGYTSSTNFPTVNAVQSSNTGTDAFVSKLNPNLSGSASLLYSTFLGGNGSNYGYGIAVDGAGNMYVTGSTSSTNFPIANAVQSSYGGAVDAFVSKLNAAGSGFIYSTYLGGSGQDGGNGIAVDRTDNAYVTGSTKSSDFPTVNALQNVFGDTGARYISGDAFVSELSTPPSGGTLPWHPHHTVRISDGLSASVDLADGHVDITAQSLEIPGRGPHLALTHVWDSILAQAGVTTTAGAGWLDSFTPNIGGAITSTLFLHRRIWSGLELPLYGQPHRHRALHDVPDTAWLALAA